MNRSLSIVILCLTILYGAPARGDDLAKGGRACCDTLHGCLPPRIPECPDDYCRKPTPCLVGLACWTCDDYCRKPLPSFCWPMRNLSCVTSYFQGNDRKTLMTKK